MTDRAAVRIDQRSFSPGRGLPLEVTVDIGAGPEERGSRLLERRRAVPISGLERRIIDIGCQLDLAVPVAAAVTVAAGVTANAAIEGVSR